MTKTNGRRGKKKYIRKTEKHSDPQSAPANGGSDLFSKNDDTVKPVSNDKFM